MLCLKSIDPRKLHGGNSQIMCIGLGVENLFRADMILQERTSTQEL
jgi:hypothetical protein